jgi:hypothetical protein
VQEIARDEPPKKSLRRGKLCEEIAGRNGEMSRIKYMYLEGARTMKEIRDEHPHFKVWDIVDELEADDQEVFNHPRQWGTGYPDLLLSKYFKKDVSTIRDNWRKNYRAWLRKQPQPKN